MARITKSRARAPLAESAPYHSWGESASMGQRYSIRVVGDTHSFSLDMTPNEVKSFIGFVAGHETYIYGMGAGGMGWSDKRTLVDKLRAWADKLEVQGTGQ